METERSSLLPRASPRRVEERDDLGTAAFPFHPQSRSTPMWRKLLIRFFDNRDKTKTVEASDVWPLAHNIRGDQAAAEVTRRIPKSGRMRLLRAVVAANRTEFVQMLLWGLAGIALAGAWPLLVFHLFRDGLMKLPATNERRVFGRESEILWPLVQIFSVEILLSLVSAQRREIASRVHLSVDRSLFGLVINRMAAISDPSIMSPLTRKADGVTGRKQQLTEVGSMFSIDLTRVLLLTIGLQDFWPMAARLAASIVVFANVLELSWTLSGAVIGVIASFLVVEGLILAPLSSRLVSTVSTRINAVHDSLKSIQMIKLNAWASQAKAKIYQARSSERYALLSVTAVELLFEHLLSESPMILVAIRFKMLTSVANGGSDHVINHAVIATQVLTSLIVLNDIYRTFQRVANGIQGIITGIISWQRIETFVLKPVSGSRHESTSPSSCSESMDSVIEMHSVCIRCQATAQPAPPLLMNVDLSVRRGELVIIYGAAGLGKSMLLAAIRGDTSAVQLLHGASKPLPPNCRVAYCSQDPWLQTLSIRDNILFGTAFDEQKYWAVVDACGLLEDLSVLPLGDATVVGPRGINLSSGQSARIALARACYADADLYLLDCPLANVDAVVQSEIFRKCVVELLLYKTVVIVTHNPEYIGSSFVDKLVKVQPTGVRVISSENKRWSLRLRDRPDKQRKFGLGYRSLIMTTLSSESRGLAQKIELSRKSEAPKRIQLDPTLTPSTFWAYARSGGVTAVVWLAIGIVLSIPLALATVARDLWIVKWADDATQSNPGPAFACFAATCIALEVLVDLCFQVFNSTSAAALFLKATNSVLFASMSFFYTTPLGETIKRFYNDMAPADAAFAPYLSLFVCSVASNMGRAIVLCWFLGPISLISMGFGCLAVTQTLTIEFFSTLKKLVDSATAQKLTSMAEFLDGEPVIRAFGASRSSQLVGAFKAVNELLDRVRRMMFTFNSYIILRSEIIMAIVGLLHVALLAVRPVSSAELMIILLYVFLLQRQLLECCGTGYANVCLVLNSIRHLQDFANIPIELEYDPYASPFVSLTPQEWPQFGRVVFEHVNFSYESTQNCDVAKTLALRDVSFSIRGGENIGVVGRTGSGKSSLTMALLRVHPLRSGRILIDGVDIRHVPLSRLRQSFTIIPQSPTFYRCSVRDYMDPFHEFEDARLWKELLSVDLGHRVQSLDDELLDNGENWSQGQRQLLCFARALLKPSRVVILDEAFSCIDQQCQEKILGIVRERFVGSTVVLITHRLDQILGFDRILVMRGGRLVESGSAEELASNPGGEFYEFLETSLLTL